MKSLTRAQLIKKARKLKPFYPGTSMRNGYYYWMDSEGYVWQVPFEYHYRYAAELLDKLGLSRIVYPESYLHRMGWRRIGIESWIVYPWPHNLSRKQSRVVKNWCEMHSPKARIGE